MRILLIADNDCDRNHVLKALTGYDVFTADTYPGSLELISKDPHDLYLVDSHIGMPEGNGFKLMREARSAGCTAPLILLTSTENEQTKREVLAAGGNNLLLKKELTVRGLEDALLCGDYHTDVITHTKRRNAVLEKLFRKKTEQVEYMEQQIKELSGRAKELNGLKSRLLVMVPHEFRTPLTTIYSSAELISRYTRSDQEDNRRRHVERIKACVNKFLLTLDDLKTLDACNEDKIVIRNEVLNVFSLCRQVVKEVEECCSTQLVRYSHLSSAAVAQTDPRLLTFIVRQLLLNAIKFSQGKHAVLFTTSIDNTMLEIWVSDKGIGIPEEDQQLLFEPFFRASNALSIPGTGIGLSLVAAYIKKMNGRIAVESVKDKGTTFRLALPGAYAY